MDKAKYLMVSFLGVATLLASSPSKSTFLDDSDTSRGSTRRAPTISSSSIIWGGADLVGRGTWRTLRFVGDTTQTVANVCKFITAPTHLINF